MNMKLTARNTHRDLGYFFIGLIISFSLSGIFFNHRQSWNPKRYTYESKMIQVGKLNKDSISAPFVKKFTKEHGIDDEVRKFRIEENKLRISYVNHDVSINLATGKGKIETYRVTPILGHMMDLHKETSNWWIYYSDIFDASMIVIAATGMFIQKGKHGFRIRGWKLALIGISFPLIFLFLIS